MVQIFMNKVLTYKRIIYMYSIYWYLLFLILMAGPIEKNIDDFWRMISELKIQKIVMVTNCIEEGKVNGVSIDLSNIVTL